MKREPDGPGSRDDAWEQLVRYHLLAVRRAGVAEPVPIGDGGSWRILGLQSELLVTGRGEDLVVEPTVAGMFEGLAPGDAVFYGWPMVIATDGTGRRRVAPLLMTEIILGDDDVVRVARARDDMPYLNPGLLSDAFFSRDALAAADESFGVGLPFGDATATTDKLCAVLAALGIDGSSLDPDHLGASRSDRPGVYNLAMVFRGASNAATHALVSELEKLGVRRDWEQTAAAHLLSLPRSDDSAGPDPIAAAQISGVLPLSVKSLDLNDSQEQALIAGLSRPVTVVTGPPGTGKSQLVAAIVINQWCAGRNVLVASTNNGAVDVAVARCAAIDPALLVRTGKRELREELPGIVKGLAARQSTLLPSPETLSRQVDRADAARTAVLDRLAERARAEGELARLVLDQERWRTILWGSTDPSPVQDEHLSIYRKARTIESSFWFRTSRFRRLRNRMRVKEESAELKDVLAWAQGAGRVDELTAMLERLGPADPEIDRREVEEAERRRAEAGSESLADSVQRTLKYGSNALNVFAGLRPHARSRGFVKVLKYLPGWACTALSVEANFPLQAALFDLLVIDEASQCGIADILPLAYRARRIVVVGDPNQLTPVVALSSAALKSIAASVHSTPGQMHEAALSVGEDSGFTAYSARFPDDQYLLDVHYRCHPDIARFFNTQFYGGALQVLTAVQALSPGPAPRGLSFVDVRGHTVRGEKGGAYNVFEADAIVEWVISHIAGPGTLGVVTPFAAQADYIRGRLEARLGKSTVLSSGLAVGTAHRFQGGERDTVLFSLVIAEGAGHRTARWVEGQRNLVNVAVSRARRSLVVFGDATALPHYEVPTLHALIQACTRTAIIEQPTPVELHDVADLHSYAEQRLFAALGELGVATSLKLRVEGYELDFAIDVAGKKVNVEVDGSHHYDERGRQRRQDLARDLVLEGLGWRVLRIPAWRCLSTPRAAASTVFAYLHGDVAPK